MLPPAIELSRAAHAERVARDLEAVRMARLFATGQRRSLRHGLGRALLRLGAWLSRERLAVPSGTPLHASR